MTILQKTSLSFLLSAFLCAGIAALVLTGIFDPGEAVFILPQSVMILTLTAVFLSFFLIIFFCFNLRKDAAEEDGDIPYFNPVEFSGFELTIDDADGTVHLVEDAEPAELEDISAGHGGNFMISQPFAFFTGNPELLQGTGNQESGVSGEMIYEEDGIHYVNNDAFKHRDGELDNNFAKLVESVVNKE